MEATVERNEFVLEVPADWPPSARRHAEQTFPGITTQVRRLPLSGERITNRRTGSPLGRRVPWLRLTAEAQNGPDRLRLFLNTLNRWQWWAFFVGVPLGCWLLHLRGVDPEVLSFIIAVALPAWLIVVMSLGPRNRFELTIDSAQISFVEGRKTRRTLSTSEISHAEIYRYVGSEGSHGSIGYICFNDGTWLGHHHTIPLLRAAHWFREDLILRSIPVSKELAQHRERKGR